MTLHATGAVRRIKLEVIGILDRNHVSTCGGYGGCCQVGGGGGGA